MPRLILLVAALAWPGAAVAQIKVDAFNARLRAMPPEQQRAAMRQAVTNNGLRCGRVTAAGYQQPFRNLHMWTATCVPGGRYAVFVGPDQSVQARPCADAPSLRLPTCR